MSTKHGLYLIGLLAFLALPSRPVQADPTEAKPLPLIRIKPLEDRGGLNVRDENGKPLNESLTTGLLRYIKERGKGRIEAADTRLKPAPSGKAGQPALTLEGDLSHVATDDNNGGPYLLTLRLMEEGKLRRIAAQWAGSAQTLMSLSSNIRRDPRISNDGMVGELGNRVVETVAAYGSASAQEQQKEFAGLIEKAAKGAALTAEPVVGDKATGLKDGAFPLVSRSPFGLDVRAPHAGAVYVIGVGASGQLRPLLLPPMGKEVILMADKPTRLPTASFWQATETRQPVKEEIVVLLRRSPAPPLREKTQAQNQAQNDAPAMQMAGFQDGKAPGGQGLEEPLYVTVLDGGNRILPRASGDAEIARLLDMARTDAPGTWTAVRLPLQITPQAKAVTHVVAVGINTYPHLEDANLKFARKDAERVAEYFKQQAADVTLLTEEQATRANVIKALEKCVESAKPDDILILYWAGHATLQGQTWKIMPSDASGDEANNGLDIDTLYARLTASRANRTLLLCDAYSGDAGEALKRLTAGKFQGDRSFGFLGSGPGSEDSKRQGGAFTAALLSALLQKSATFQDLSINVAVKLQKELAAEGKISSMLAGPNFPVTPDL